MMASLLANGKRDPAAPHAVEVAGRLLPVTIRRHARARRLTLRVAPDGSEARITIPRWGRVADALSFAQDRKGWIAAQLAKVPPPCPIGAGAVLPVRGEPVTIAWDASHRRTPQLAGSRLLVGGPADRIAARIEAWLRATALPLLHTDLAFYCERAGVARPDLKLSSARRRWGACSGQASGRTIRINWRLVMAPDAVRRSVVAHEVAHLVHFDHSPAFHALLGRIFEGDITQADRWLKREGRGLYAFFP